MGPMPCIASFAQLRVRHAIGKASRMRTLFLLAFWLPTVAFAQHLQRVVRSEVTFVSEAPLERIAATNRAVTGLFDLDQRSFAIRVPIVEFQGFNAPLQREHFNENYLLSGKFPHATFNGRIIEAIDLRKPGTYRVRAKGEFAIRGITQERIVPCTVVVTADGMRVTTELDVVLEEHDIRIPRIVNQKIAPVVQVAIDLRFEPRTP